MMLARKLREGEQLDVAGLNTITVLVDRTEAEMTEIALNTWRAEMTGPPHFHNEKEQMFFIVTGTGQVRVAGETRAVGPNDLVFLPAGTEHQTMTGPGPVEYLLYNGFLSREREGHASFRDHIEKVKEVRKAQAERQTADVVEQPDHPEGQGQWVPTGNRWNEREPFVGAELLVSPGTTRRGEAWLLGVEPGEAHRADPVKEWLFLVLKGAGTARGEGEPLGVEPGMAVFVPRGEGAVWQGTGAEPLTLLAFGTRLEG